MGRNLGVLDPSGLLLWAKGVTQPALWNTSHHWLGAFPMVPIGGTQ